MLVEAFFVATFRAWANYNRSGNNRIYVGYCPAIGIDSERMIKDFPEIKIVHIVRNPFSAYANTKMRPFPFSLERYALTWNIYHHTVSVLEQKYSGNIKIFRFEDIVDSTEETMMKMSDFIGIQYNKTMLYPSFNSTDISKNISPWGAVEKSTSAYNIEVAKSLSKEEISELISYTANLLNLFGYDGFYNLYLK